MGTVYFQNANCTIMRRGHFSVPPRTELRFDATKPFEFTVINFSDLDKETPETVEQWVLPIEMFKSLRTLRGRGNSAGIMNADITVTVPKSLSAWRQQVIIDLDIRDRNRKVLKNAPARLVIPWRDIKRFMRLVEKILRKDPSAKDDYIEGAALKLLGRF